MIATTAIPQDATRRTLSSVLADAGWQVFHAHDADEAVVLCRRSEADVLLVDDAFPGGAIGLLDRLKRDSELFRVAVVIVGDGLAVDAVLSAMKRGAEDVLRTPLDPADVIARATAAGPAPRRSSRSSPHRTIASRSSCSSTSSRACATGERSCTTSRCSWPAPSATTARLPS